MKFLLFSIIAFIIFCCSTSKDDKPLSATVSGKEDNSLVEFDIQGEVEGKDGQKIALVFSEKRFDDRLVTTIEEGRFQFVGTHPEMKRLLIAYEDDILNGEDMVGIFPVFLEKGVKVKAHPDTIGKSEFISGNLNIQARSLYDKEGEYHQASSELFDKYLEANEKGLEKEAEEIFAQYQLQSKLDKYTFYRGQLLSADDPIIPLAYLHQAYKYNFFDDDTLQHYFSLLNDDVKSLGYYKEIEAYLEGKKKISIGERYIDYDLEDLDQNQGKLSSAMKGKKVVLLDFWASWCKPCRFQNKTIFREMYDNYHDKGFEIISISVDENKEKWDKASKEDNIGWMNLWANSESLIPQHYDVQGYPTTYLIDGDGIIIGKNLNEKDLEGKLKSMLSK